MSYVNSPPQYISFSSLVKLGVLVLHVPLQVKLFELRESAEAEEADDLPPEVVAQVPLRPDPLEGPTVAHAVRDRLWQIGVSFILKLNLNLITACFIIHDVAPMGMGSM